MSQDSKGNFYVADYRCGRIREITAFAGYGLSTDEMLLDSQLAWTVSDFQAVTVSAVGPMTISGVTTGFSKIDDYAGTTLATGQSCEVDVYIQPTAAGRTNGTLRISSNAFFGASNLNTVALSGVATGAPNGAVPSGTSHGRRLRPTPSQ